MILAGLLLVFPSLIEALVETITPLDVDYAEYLGIVIGAVVLAKQWLTRRAMPAAAADSGSRQQG